MYFYLTIFLQLIIGSQPITKNKKESGVRILHPFMDGVLIQEEYFNFWTKYGFNQYSSITRTEFMLNSDS
jgi:hypothetical protein